MPTSERTAADDPAVLDLAVLMASPVRRAIVAALERAAGDGGPVGRTAAQLAQSVGLHVTTVRFHLDQLVAAGILRVDAERHDGPGRPRNVYALAPGETGRAGRSAPSATSGPLRLLADLLVDTVSASLTGAPADPVEAGRAWARQHVPRDDGQPARTPQEWLDRVGLVTDSLREWGYHPELVRDEHGWTARVELTDCPFMDIARRDTAVVCGIHAGLITEAAHRLGAPDAVTSLEPFVGPARCRAHIARPAETAGSPPPPSDPAGSHTPPSDRDPSTPTTR